MGKRGGRLGPAHHPFTGPPRLRPGRPGGARALAYDCLERPGDGRGSIRMATRPAGEGFAALGIDAAEQRRASASCSRRCATAPAARWHRLRLDRSVQRWPAPSDPRRDRLPKTASGTDPTAPARSTRPSCARVASNRANVPRSRDSGGPADLASTSWRPARARPDSVPGRPASTLGVVRDFGDVRPGACTRRSSGRDRGGPHWRLALDRFGRRTSLRSAPESWSEAELLLSNLD